MTQRADVCLILEGTYPYISGGVAAWTHDLILSHSHLTFHILSILPRDFEPRLAYQLPPNVISVTNIHLQQLPVGRTHYSPYGEILTRELKGPLEALNNHASMEDFISIVRTLAAHKHALGSELLLDSMDTWKLLIEMYENKFSESSFLDYFWSWRAIMGSLYSIILAPLPDAGVYHALSTGYAGLMLARAKVETGRPALLTEHGIYTNERRIEIASADWLEETASKALTIDKTRQNLRDLWINTFSSYSRICYEACDQIITLFAGNQDAQQADGAEPGKMRVIPNGVPIDRYGSIVRLEKKLRPTVALIGRVVPIKDVKNFIRACGVVRDLIPDLKALIIGPTDEDLEYFYECHAMIEHMALDQIVTFTGKVSVEEYLPEIDVIVLTSISEAMPLVILEAGACGIPTIATDVGSCKEIIYGRNENPWLGEGGIITPLANPTATAEAIYSLLRDEEKYANCSNAIRERVKTYYNIDTHMRTYRELYDTYLQ